MTTQPWQQLQTSKGLQKGDVLFTWTLQAGDTAQPLIVPRYADKSVHIWGVWGGATINLNQTNDENLANWQLAYDTFETAITQSADRKLWIILPNSFALMPELVGGDMTTLLKVAVVGRGGSI